MERNKKLILITIALIFIIVAVATVARVQNDHVNNLYKVVEEKIEYNAQTCFLQEICKGNETTLEYLITNGFLGKQIDPITKEYIDEKTVISFDGKECNVKLR